MHGPTRWICNLECLLQCAYDGDTWQNIANITMLTGGGMPFFGYFVKSSTMAMVRFGLRYEMYSLGTAANSACSAWVL